MGVRKRSVSVACLPNLSRSMSSRVRRGSLSAYVFSLCFFFLHLLLFLIKIFDLTRTNLGSLTVYSSMCYFTLITTRFNVFNSEPKS